MKLMETLNQCINAGHEMTKAIAIAFKMMARKRITRRWRIGEAADLVGVSSQAIRDARKQGDYRTRIWKFEDGLSNVLVIQLNKLIICVMCLVRDCDVLKTYFHR